MGWRLAFSLAILRAQIDLRWPKRSKVSDGTIGDRAHAGRRSDHNPNSKGVVCAFDITEDFKNGPDLTRLMPLLLKDPRTKYCIYETYLYKPDGSKQKNKGHTQHLHISVSADEKLYDDPQPWLIEARTDQEAILDLQSTSLTPKPAVRAPLTLSGHPEEQKVNKMPKYDPQRAVSFFVGRSWSEEQACALTAGIIWESGGNGKAKGQTPSGHTIIWDAKGDKDKKTGVYNSCYAPQWNGPRKTAFERYAIENQRDFLDPYIQLAYVSHELFVLEKKAGARLRAAKTLEEANTAAISYWRPGIPHANERLKIAKKLLAS